MIDVMNRQIDMSSRWLEKGAAAKGTYYIELQDGRRGEANSPLALYDLLVDPDYSECDDRQTHLIMLGLFARNVSVQLAAQAVRTTVYDGVGPFYDPAVLRFPDEKEEREALDFVNSDRPYIIDFWDEWTLMASLIRCGYLRLFEKVETFGAADQERKCATCFFYDKEQDGCRAWNASRVAGRMEKTCPFWTNSFFGGDDYLEVRAEDLFEPRWNPNYRPIADRTIEYEGFRIQSRF